ncbi:replication initiation protein [Paraburkholderia flava]|uniref:replication initiation protein n=1 Tax=Paraburkholderia flava TaxID=2547393 RepID=UPI00106001C7|nr:replication initiation protein [Paraburkholderia flava]
MKQSPHFMRLVQRTTRTLQERASHLRWLLDQPSIQAYYDSLRPRPLVSPGKDESGSLAVPTREWKGICNFYTHVERNQTYRKFIVIDIDQGTRSLDMWSEKDMPEPTFIVRNRQSGNCQYFYQLKTAVAWHDNARKRIQEYFEAVELALTITLEGDPDYHSALARNPLHASHQVIVTNAIYTLSSLESFFDRDEYPRGINSFSADHFATHLPPDELKRGSRNCTLFETLRQWAYGAIFSPLGATEEAWQRAVETMAVEVNGRFDTPLPYSEVKIVVKSVGQWVWKHRDTLAEETINRGAYREQIDENLPLLDKQSQSAQITNAHRTDSTREKISDAVIALKEQGHMVDQMSVIEASGLSRNTVKKYWNLVRLLNRGL